MKGTTMRAAVLGLMAAAAVPAGHAGAQEGTFRWNQAMSAGQVLEVKGIVGEIRVEPASGGTAEVVAKKEGRSRDFDQVEIRVEEERDGFTVCAVYHPDRARGDGCDPDYDHDRRQRGRRDIDVEVMYTVRLPAGVEFVGGMVSGDIVVEDVRSRVRAGTVSGDVYVSTSESAEGSTVNGDIEVRLAGDAWRELDFNTVSGDITLWLPEGIDTDVAFESLSGDIDSDFDITSTRRRRARWIGAELEGYIGERGRRALNFNTVSGDVDLRRMR